MKRFFLIIWICLLGLAGGFSQEMPLYFDHLTKDDGLSSNRVNCIYEDSREFIWFGTEDGLNKYDGYSFEIFRNNPEDSTTIVENSIVDIIEDKHSGNLIVATQGGLVIFDRSLYHFRQIFKEELELSPDMNYDIQTLCQDAEGHLFVGTRHGLFKFDLTEKRLLHHYSFSEEMTRSIRNNVVSSLFKAEDDKIWIGHDRGIDILDSKSGEIKAFQKDAGITEVNAIHEDPEGGMWIGSNLSGLYYFEDPTSGDYKLFNRESGHLTGNRVHGIIEQDDNSFLIIVRDDALYEFDPDSLKFVRYIPDIYNPKSINSKAVISSFKSSRGIIWIGTYSSGINYIDNQRKNFEHYAVNFKEEGLFNNNVRALFEDSEGYIWIGTKEGGGLSRFDRETKTFKNYRKSDAPSGLHDDYILSISELDEDRLIVGTLSNGLAIFNKNTEQFNYYKNDPDNPSSLSYDRIYVLHNDNEGLIWVGTWQDLQTFDPPKGEFTTIEGIPIPKCILQEDKNRLWIGTRQNGLFLYDKQTGKKEQYLYNAEDQGSIPSNDIYALTLDQDNVLWIGTKRGLCRLNVSRTEFDHYTVKDGLLSNWICGLETDDANNIWISTVNGLSMYNHRTDEFRNFDILDGLQSNEFEIYVSLKTRDGHMLFGGRKGFNMFLPENIIDNTNIPEIAITGFKLYNKEVPIGVKRSPLNKHISQTDSINLNYDQTAFTFDYTALNYTSPEKNNYAYILHGFDSEWIQAGTKRSAVYTNIPPGSYTFQVIGSNNDGHWNMEGSSLAIEIAPPPWKTDLAYFIYIVVLLGLFFLIRRILIIRIKQKQLIEFERKDKERIQELNQMKLSFFTNISHEFRTPLTLISGPLDKLMSYKDENDERRYLLKIMRNNVKRMLLLINELMDFRKADQGKLKLHITKHDPVKMVDEVIHCFEESALSKNTNINFNYDIKDREEFWFDKSIIDKVIFNLMANALKYTEGGKISIDMHPEGDMLYVSISDSGRGISKEDLKGIFERFYRVEDKQPLHLDGTGIGLAFSKRLLLAHKGEIEVESVLNIGSKFTIHFPVSLRYYDEKEIIKTDSFIKDEDIKLPSFDKLQQVITKKATEKKLINRKKILIVEDNEELRNYLAKNFNSFSVFQAENGKMAYKIASKELPDIIISDIMMSEMDGIKFCGKIKSHLATSHIPVILLSAKSEITSKIEGMGIGADAYIEKPFEMSYLDAVVKNILRQRENLRKRFISGPEVNLNELNLNSHEKKFIEKTRNIIEKNIGNPDFSVEDLGMELGLSRSQLFRKFRTLYEMKPNEKIRTERLKKAKELLATREYNINEIASRTGFKSSSYFITSFKRYYGETPNEYFSRFIRN